MNMYTHGSLAPSSSSAAILSPTDESQNGVELVPIGARSEFRMSGAETGRNGGLDAVRGVPDGLAGISRCDPDYYAPRDVVFADLYSRVMAQPPQTPAVLENVDLREAEGGQVRGIAVLLVGHRRCCSHCYGDCECRHACHRLPLLSAAIARCSVARRYKSRD